MTTLDVPCDGRATFHRMNVRALHELLLAEERHAQRTTSFAAQVVREMAIETFLRPVAYLHGRIGT